QRRELAGIKCQRRRHESESDDQDRRNAFHQAHQLPSSATAVSCLLAVVVPLPLTALKVTKTLVPEGSLSSPNGPWEIEHSVAKPSPHVGAGKVHEKVAKWLAEPVAGNHVPRSPLVNVGATVHRST